MHVYFAYVMIHLRRQVNLNGKAYLNGPIGRNCRQLLFKKKVCSFRYQLGYFGKHFSQAAITPVARPATSIHSHFHHRL